MKLSSFSAGQMQMEDEIMKKDKIPKYKKGYAWKTNEVWYCGDNPKADIEGASQAGIFPVWYENDTDDRDDAAAKKEIPQCEHLHIHEWEEMTALLER